MLGIVLLTVLYFQAAKKRARSTTSPAKSGESPAKRGRGRPKGSGKKGKAAKAKVNAVHVLKSISSDPVAILYNVCYFLIF